MLPVFVTRLLLFGSSYSPLWVILAFRVRDWPILSSVLLTAALVLTGFLYLFLANAYRAPTTRLVVKRWESRDHELVAYLLTYILPFLNLGSSRTADRVSLLIFFGVIAILQIQSGMLHVNPMLAIVGIRVSVVENPSGKVMMLFSRNAYLAPGRSISVVSISDTLVMEKRNVRPTE
jgi:hypothetical protein